MHSTHKPIGYWLRYVDQLIEANFERVLADFGLSRRHWQTLNVLAAGPQAEATLAAALAPFWADGARPPREQVLDELRLRGWIEDCTGQRALTRAGRAAHQEVADRVRLSRQQTTDGLSQLDYETTVRTLERMAANLQAALAQA